ncbi:MAG: YqeG family HAD IIIA-type phosphatase [Candidatus Merdivicinus sp.]|jgi:HAD superfamily phosphatase (TIGR01668 family)
MPIFLPREMARHVTDLQPDFFRQRGIRAIILDVDNTLTTHGNPVPAEGVPEWINRMKDEGFSVAILSNNYRERVEPFARLLGLDFISMACKPLTFGLTRACRRYGLPPAQVCLIGDQIFTDIVGGNCKGVFTILVEPYELEQKWSFRLKRKLEQPIIRKFHKKKGESH